VNPTTHEGEAEGEGLGSLMRWRLNLLAMEDQAAFSPVSLLTAATYSVDVEVIQIRNRPVVLAL
jgi:hypothetical protein